jgi:CheY-like chemotaxis protein
MAHKKRILLADDSEYFRREFSVILREDGFEVMTARDGEEAVQAAQGVKGIDLLIVNLEMPGILGFEVIKKIRRLRNAPSMPVLALSGSFEKSNINGMLQNLTVVRFLKKSTRPEEILFWVRSILFPKDKFSRRFPRIIVDFPITFWVGQAEFTGHSFTLSEDGVFIKTRFVTHLNTHARLTFTIPPDHAINTDSIVVWVNDFKPSKSEAIPFGMGLRFLDITTEDRKAIKQFVVDQLIG